ncbi:TetR/AcrR family transcriptional regulator [Dactylosporangium sp. NPDC049742]|uniref:TetR/AcrR family transcriptional regulator n=1 Tax=unclassified Dactylosporangium TaxID=2621675 RepID=UPI0033C59123
MNTQGRIIEAARTCLLADGYAALSTRRVAERAGVPLSQIHYHFGGKQGVILALLDHENQQLVARQVRMYGAETPLWKRYEQACDFLDDDLASGYVRVLQEMIAAGWSDPQVAARVTAMLEAWFAVLVQVATEAEQRFGSLGPMRPGDVAGLIGLSFLGGEAVVLLGSEDWSGRVRGWLRSVGDLIRHFEEGDVSGPSRS